MKEKLWESKYMLLILVIPCVVILLVAFLWFHNALRENINENNYEMMQETARQQLLSFETKMQGQLNQLQLYARSFKNVDMNDYKAVKEALNVTEGVGSFQTIAVANVTGKLMQNNNTSAGNIMREEYFKKAMAGEPAIDIGRTSEDTGQQEMLFAVPVYQKDVVIGVLVGTELQSNINESVMTDSFGGIGATYIIDQDGEILLHSKNSEDILEQETNFLNYLKGAKASGVKDLFGQMKDDLNKNYTGVYRYRVQGAEYIAIRNLVDFNGWSLILQVNASFVNSQSTQILVYVLRLMLLVLISMLVIVAALFRLQSHSDFLKNKAERDLLTNLLNKRTFERSVENMVTNHSKDEAGALLIIDLDNFKGVNDTLGHIVGDQVLSGVADKMRETFRQQDYLGRVGGDEFAVYLTFTNTIGEEERRDIIQSRAKYFCSVIGEIAAEIGQEAVISCSMGIAMDPEHGMTYERLYESADQALYKAKNAGKNQYQIWEA